MLYDIDQTFPNSNFFKAPSHHLRTQFFHAVYVARHFNNHHLLKSRNMNFVSL